MALDSPAYRALRAEPRDVFGPYLAAGFLLALVTAYFTSSLPL